MTGGQRPAFHDQRFGHPPQHIQDIHAQGIYDLSLSPDLIWHVYCFQYNVRENAILKAIRTWVGCGSGTETRYDYDSSWLLVVSFAIDVDQLSNNCGCAGISSGSCTRVRRNVVRAGL